MDTYGLPTEIQLDGTFYKITNNGDYRMVLDCFEALNDTELPEPFNVYTALTIFYEAVEDIDMVASTFADVNEAVEKMYRFFNCGQDKIGMSSNHKLIDWNTDSQLICSAVNNVARTEIRSVPYLHWYTFMGYFLGIGDCTLSTIIAIRNKILTNKKLERYEREFKRNNPEYFTWNTQNKSKFEEDELIKSLWNS